MSLNELAKEIHANAKSKGFHDEPKHFGVWIALIHSELSEALEEDRRGIALITGDHLEGAVVELADALIRILDTVAECWPGLDFESVVRRKMAYNASRPALHGKAY